MTKLRELPTLFKGLALAKTVADVGASTIDWGRQTLGAHPVCAIVLDDAGTIRERTIFGSRDVDFEEWYRDWRPQEDVFPTALARGAPVTALQVYGEERWRKLPAYKEFGVRLEIYHYMVVPIFGSRGSIAGAITLCRRIQESPFASHELAQAAVCSGFISATLARVMESAPGVDDAFVSGLSGRELQIARLAAAGRNNAEIALQLGIARETVKQTLRRVYNKLYVNGRAPMAAKLVSLGLVPR
jgi:DNA-binding CsgD family transcriptional regulator